MRRLFDGIEDLTGNLPMQIEIYPAEGSAIHPKAMPSILTKSEEWENG